MNHLEKAVLDIIEKRYKRKYVGKIKVVGLTQGGYKLSLYLENTTYPRIVISADIPDEEKWLKFIEKELISRQLQRVEFFKGIRTDEERGTCPED